MKAHIRDLQGKYYGTIVVFEADNGEESSLKIWVYGKEPSNREIESWGYTKKDWDENIEIDDGWMGTVKIREADCLCDGHFESKESLKIAQIIVKALNEISNPDNV